MVCTENTAMRHKRGGRGLLSSSRVTPQTPSPCTPYPLARFIRMHNALRLSDASEVSLSLPTAIARESGWQGRCASVRCPPAVTVVTAAVSARQGEVLGNECGDRLNHDTPWKGVCRAVEYIGEGEVPVMAAVDAKKRRAEVRLRGVERLYK